MVKNPNGGSGDPQNIESGVQDTPAPSDRRSRPPAADQRLSPQTNSGAQTEDRTGTQQRPGHVISPRKKQFVIAPLHSDTMQLMGLQPLGLQPLQLSAVEQALRANPDIDIVDTIGPRTAVGALSEGMGGHEGVLVALMTDQKANMLQQQGQGRLLVERDQHLALMDPVFYQPRLVTNIIPTTGAAFQTLIAVVGSNGAPLPGAEVSLFGSMLPSTGTTDENGEGTLSLVGETAASIRGLYVKPKSDYWSFYQRDPDLATDEANVVTLRPLSDLPGLAGFPRQKSIPWGQKAMRMDQLPPTYRGQGIKIAVIDSGVATTHEGLQRIRAGFDIINKKINPNTWNEDVLGHGTHCTGVIGAADLTFGLRGFAPEAEIHACKLFPGGQVSQLIDALEYCIANKIDVVNLSLGGAEPSAALEQQILRAKRAGIACIVAAGNSGGPVQYPASSPNVLAVAAIGKLEEFPPDSYHAETLTPNVDANGYFSAKFSCFGPQVGVCAPGVAIPSTVPPNNYAAWDGTSMAAPHVTGLAALVLAHHPEFQSVYTQRNAERVERLFQIIKASCRRASLADPSRIGYGLPDALVAVGLHPPLMASVGAGAAIGGMRSGLPGFIGSPIPQQAGAGLETFAMDPVMQAYAAFMPHRMPTQLPPLVQQSLGYGMIGTPLFNRGGW